jgi:hypothetical protein
VRTANLWKSGPIFSTGTKEAELKGWGAPVEPAAAGEAIERELRGQKAGETGGEFWPRVIHSISRAELAAIHRVHGVHQQVLKSGERFEIPPAARPEG